MLPVPSCDIGQTFASGGATQRRIESRVKSWLLLSPPRKRLWSEFPHRSEHYRKNQSLAALRPDDTVFEIGLGVRPGRRVVRRSRTRIAVEIDPQLQPHYRRRSAIVPDLRIGMRWSFPSIFAAADGGGSNPPYYVSTPILFALPMPVPIRSSGPHAAKRKWRSGWQRNHQRKITVCCRSQRKAAEVEVAFRVGELFPPRPTVGSAVVHLKLKAQDGVDPDRYERFRRLVRAAFLTGGKTLVNSLRDEGYPVERISGRWGRWCRCRSRGDADPSMTIAPRYGVRR